MDESWGAEWCSVAGWLAIALVSVVLIVALTRPIADGDLFWHLAYAQQMLERGTLIPDHALYSWTPARTATIYCAWLSECLFYGLHQLAGWWGLFALRYAVMLGCLALLLQFAWASGLPVGLAIAAVMMIAPVLLAIAVVYLRTTFLLPVVFGFGMLHLMATSERLRELMHSSRPVVGGAALVLLGVGALSIHESSGGLGRSDYFGLGIDHDSPVEEAEFVAQHSLPRDLYKVFDSGGYLLWRLHPQLRVMVDSRAFPYHDWFDDQYAFANGERFDAVLANSPADLAVIDLEKRPVWRSFANAKAWLEVGLKVLLAGVP